MKFIKPILVTFSLLLVFAIVIIIPSKIMALTSTVTCEPYPGAGDNGGCFRVNGSLSYCEVTRSDENMFAFSCDGGNPDTQSGISVCSFTTPTCTY